jgi:hypothetical protein
VQVQKSEVFGPALPAVDSHLKMAQSCWRTGLFQPKSATVVVAFVTNQNIVFDHLLIMIGETSVIGLLDVEHLPKYEHTAEVHYSLLTHSL